MQQKIEGIIAATQNVHFTTKFSVCIEKLMGPFMISLSTFLSLHVVQQIPCSDDFLIGVSG